MKKILFAVLALGLGTATFAVQVRQEKLAAVPQVLSPDGPEPDCLPNCGDPGIK